MYGTYAEPINAKTSENPVHFHVPFRSLGMDSARLGINLSFSNSGSTLAESIPGSLNVYKFGLYTLFINPVTVQMCLQTVACSHVQFNKFSISLPATVLVGLPWNPNNIFLDLRISYLYTLFFFLKSQTWIFRDRTWSLYY